MSRAANARQRRRGRRLVAGLLLTIILLSIAIAVGFVINAAFNLPPTDTEQAAY